MPEHLPAWMGNIQDVLPASSCGVIVTLVAVLCGAAVGMERGKRQKPAGLRTMMLICLGAAVFTQVGVLLVGPEGDAGRVAAQVVTGVGFLGAGSIIHGRGKVTGFTTAAAIWVVAAVGVTIGAGYIVAGAFITVVVLATLMLESTLDAFIDGPCESATATISFVDDGGKTRWLIQEALDAQDVDVRSARFESSADGAGRLTLRYCHRHRQHRAALPAIAAVHGVQSITEVKE